jgi:hypothetical protein
MIGSGNNLLWAKYFQAAILYAFKRLRTGYFVNEMFVDI